MFDQKLIKRAPRLQKKPPALQRALQNKTFLHFFLFLKLFLPKNIKNSTTTMHDLLNISCTTSPNKIPTSFGKGIFTSQYGHLNLNTTKKDEGTKNSPPPPHTLLYLPDADVVMLVSCLEELVQVGPHQLPPRLCHRLTAGAPQTSSPYLIHIHPCG